MTEKKRKQVDGDLASIFVKKAKHELLPSLDSTSQVTPAAKQLSLEEFALLLDFSSVQEEEEIKSRLDRISRSLLHDFRLAVRRADGRETEFQVLEAEFYLQIEGIHDDPFTHGSEEQKFSGRWYFHRAPRRSEDSHRSLTSTTAYRSGSRKGMDLTFGAPLQPSISKYFSSKQPSTSNLQSANSVTAHLRGGILLRSIRQLGSNGKITSGPSLLVDQILSASGSPSIEDLVENKWEGNISAFTFDEGSTATCLYLKAVKPEDRKTLTKVYFSPRIGLDLSHPGTTGPATLPLHPRIKFITKHYRFFVLPDKLVANGRPQTFLGILQSFLESSPSLAGALGRPSLSGEVANLMGLKASTAAKYLSDFKAGRQAGLRAVESVVGPKGKGASSSPATYLNMMGALSTL